MAPVCYLFYFSYYVITASDCFLQSRTAAIIGNIWLILLYMRLRRDLFLDKSNINRDKPCSAEWLFATITKCCYQGYSFSIPLRENAICLKEKTMFKHRIWIQYYEKIDQTMIEYFVFLFNREEMNKIKMPVSGRSRASAQEMCFQ